MIKILSVFLSFAVLFTSVAPSYAQALDASRIQKKRISLSSGDWRRQNDYTMPSDNTRVVRPQIVVSKQIAQKVEKVETALKESVQQAQANAQQDKVDEGVAHINKILRQEQQAAAEYRRRGGATIGPAQSTANHYVPVLPRLDFIYQGTPNENGTYRGKELSKQNWAWAGLRMDLKGMSKQTDDWDVETSWNRQLGRSEYVAGGNMVGTSTEIVKAIAAYGVSKQDEALAREFLTKMLQRDGLCKDNRKAVKMGNVDSKNVNGAYEYNLRTVPMCQYSTDVLEALAVLAVQHNDKKAVDGIYNFMTAKHREGLGSLVVYQGAVLLMGINSIYSYETLKKFLKENARQNTTDKILGNLAYVSFEGLSRLAQEQTSSGRHLDNYTARYAYLDEAAASKYYPNLDLKIVTAQPLTSDGKYQLPMGNVYEDIGALLANDAANNNKSAALAKDILTSQGYNWPLAEGVLLANEGKFASSALGDKAVALWQALLSANYTDMNEGTQRRMKTRAAMALVHKGALSQAQAAAYQQKDTNKFAQYSRQEKINFGLGALDVLTIIVTLPLLIKSAVNGSVKMVAKLRNFGKVGAKASAKTTTVARTSGKSAAAASAAKPAPAPAPAAPRAAAVSSAEAEAIGKQWVAAAQEAEAAKAAQTSAWQAAQAEKEAARMAAAADFKVAGPAISSSKPIKPTWVQTEVTNSLGQKVMGWRPVNPTVTTSKPSLLKTLWDDVSFKGANVWYDTKEIFGDLTRAFRRKTATAALALSLNMTPLPSAGMQAVLQAESGLGNLVRTEQVFAQGTSLLKMGAAPAWTLPATSAVNTASVLPINNVLRLGTAAKAAAPVSQASRFPLLAFVPAVATPETWRQLGSPRFFTGKGFSQPQFVADYLKQDDAYKQEVATVQAVKAEEQKQAAQNPAAVFAKQRAAWERFFPNGAFNAEVFETALRHRLSSSLVLSMNGLGTAMNTIRNSRAVKKASELVSRAYQDAVLEASRTGISVRQAFAKHLSGHLSVEFSSNSSGDIKSAVLSLFALPMVNFSKEDISNPLSSQEVFSMPQGDDFMPQSGFRLTYVETEDGKETVLPVSLVLDPRIKADGYNRITFNENFHAQLRNGTQEPKTMSHFFFKFLGTPQQWKEFTNLIVQAKLPTPFRIKLQHRPNVAVKTVLTPLYTADGMQALPIEVEIGKKDLPPQARVVLMEDGQLGILKPFSVAADPITDQYIRLPKNQIANMVQVLKNSTTVFPIGVLPTKNKAALLYRDQQVYNNSLGKTMGPIIHSDLGISSASATSLMMVINYVIPGLASFLNPVLRRMGEKRLSVVAGFMTSLANFLPPLVGFYGLAQDHSASKIAIAVIISAFIVRSAASVLQQVTSNMLVSANSGKIKEKKKEKAEVGTTGERITFKDLVTRMKAVWKKDKENTEDIRDLLMYNLSFVYKNLGTLLFLALPWAINKAIFWTTGIDSHLVYSVSFPIFGLYSLWVTIRTLRANLRDAYTVPTVTEATRKSHAIMAEVASALAQAEASGALSEQGRADLLENSAKKVQERASTMLEAYRKEGKKKAELAALRSTVMADLEKEVIENLKAALPGEEGTKLAQDFSATIHHLENNTTSPWQVFLHAPSVALITLGMTLASVHEFSISSAFAMNLNKLISDGDMANLLVAVSLYVPLIIGRLLGNLLATRISSATMYLFCSGLSALGTVIMLGAGGNVTLSIIGAVITSLGVGNYFSQMYNYVTKKNPKLQREISVVLAVTMALAGGLTVPASHLNEWFGGTNLDIWYAMGNLIASLALTSGMMKKSTLVKFIKSSLLSVIESFKKNKNDKGDSDVNNQLPAENAEPLPNN